MREQKTSEVLQLETNTFEFLSDIIDLQITAKLLLHSHTPVADSSHIGLTFGVAPPFSVSETPRFGIDYGAYPSMA